ncbi:hypothetical protein ASZ78_007963 [Callipepla squamata]|uniref:C-C motif chemokine n=1 Tax=Callipepla squamata TaxID=9009 RepID=A0A226MM55_CALSU|nr:hypothetical protein ASZ78_007963 [Callipepla squamata]
MHPRHEMRKHRNVKNSKEKNFWMLQESHLQASSKQGEMETAAGCAGDSSWTQDNADMKVSVAALAVLIAVCYQTSAAPAPCPMPLLTAIFAFSVGSDPPTSCCFTYISRQLPFNFMADYYETNSQCPHAGVVFITKKGREVCANPENEWVQDYMNKLELNL